MSPPLPMHISHNNRGGGGSSYFTEFTLGKGILYFSSFIYVLAVIVVALMEPYVSLPCDGEKSSLAYANPAFDSSPCNRARFARLLWVTREECSYARRLAASVVMGGVIGWERRQADRPAGIRTMALVSLGSALFTICSIDAFLTGPMAWDASRVSAAIPSGVGFLGAGLIFKEMQEHGPDEGGGTTHVVHGLTTAASVWLSAAVGIACGGGLYFAASFGAAIMLLLLRFGPRNKDLTDDDDHTNDAGQHEDPYGGHPLNNQASTSTRQMSKRMSERGVSERGVSERGEPGETDSLVSENTARRTSCASIRRNRSALSTML